MADREDLLDWTVQALKALGGKGKIAKIAEYIWNHHEKELRESGDLFFTWQYEMRWAGTRLVQKRKLTKTGDGKRGVWQLI